MKIGVLAPYLDTRKDVLNLLNILSQKHNLIFYIRKSDEDKISRLLTFATVLTIPVINGISGFCQIIWKFIYLLFGRIPASKYNYYMTERIKLLNSAYKKWPKLLQSTLLLLSRITPKIISYDQYLNGLLWIKSPDKIDWNIDIFLCFTEIYDDWFFARILSQNKPVWTYTYSWDHPCKMKTFSKRTNYLVWNEGLKNDLILLQNIEADKIHILGSTQFAYIQEFINSKDYNTTTSPYNFQYLYFGFATGYDELTNLEIKYCLQIAEQLQKSAPDWKLVIRPYPFQKNQSIYQMLNGLNNVIFDLDISANAKFLKIKHAGAFLHFGTTMGYEASFFDTPSFLLDFVDKKKDPLLYKFVHQYQNDKYLNQPDNLTIKSEPELVQLLETLLSTKSNKYSNNKSSSSTALNSFSVLAENLLSLISFNK